MRNQNHYTFDSQFHDFITGTLLPSTAMSDDDFWNGFTNSLDALRDVQVVEKPATETDPGISLLDTRRVIRALNTRWGSLYSALYNEDTIPQSAGLKATGQLHQAGKCNEARRKRVVNYAREFLDATFPLTDGSHKDAVSYLVYYQNMMVILADGSTTGLKNPAQFVAKSGAKCEPEAIFLSHQNQHVELVFNRHGVTGAQDLAHIDDIRIEAATTTLLDCSAETIAVKCEIYRHMMGLVHGDLQAESVSGNTHNNTPGLNHPVPCTARNGDDIFLQSCNRPSVNLQSTGPELSMVVDRDGHRVPQQYVDACMAAVIATGKSKQGTPLFALLPHSGISDALNRLTEIPDTGESRLIVVTGVAVSNITSKDKVQPADTLPNQFSGV